jgi:hypothetical protein
LRWHASEAEFDKLHKTGDATLEAPVLILSALQSNFRSGRLPPRESNGTTYLKIPWASYKRFSRRGDQCPETANHWQLPTETG